MNRRTEYCFRGVFAGLFFSAAALAGGGPLQVLVVVNDRSSESLELGTHYAQTRSIPPRQICHISVHTNYDLDWFGFTNGIRDPIMRHLGDQGLSNQIDYIVFSRDIPYRIFTNSFSDNRHAGLTATMFHGLKTSPNASGGCELAPGSDNPYYFAERSFRHSDATGSNRLYLSSLLTGLDLDQALRLVDRAATADGTTPASIFHFLHTSDAARNVQWPNFDAADFMARFLSAPVERRMTESDLLPATSNVVSYMTGLPSVPDTASSLYVPGAYSEHLTSYGGVLFEPSGQMSLLEWIRVGNAGSYGTVVEPCNYTNKFTEPAFLYWYARGFNLAESQYMAVRNPYQGVLVADPLCAPFATGLPHVVIGGLTTGSIISNSVLLAITGTAASAAGRVERIDLYVDDRFTATLTNAPPTPGNEARVVIGSSTSSYVVTLGDDLAAVARGLANAVNAGGAFRATNHGDRVLLTHKIFGVSASNVAYGFTTLQGAAPELTLSGSALSSNLLDTTSPAREYLVLEGTANTGDLVVLTITLTNGIVATNAVTAAAGETPASLLQRLMNAVNADPLLTGTNGIAARFLNDVFGPTYSECELEARTPGPLAYSNLVDFLIVPALPASGLDDAYSFTSRMDDNRDVLRARGTVLLHAGRATVVATQVLDTTTLPDGPHTLTAVAYDGSGVALQGRASVAFAVSNHPIACILQPAAFNLMWGQTATVSVSATTTDGTVTQLVLLAEGKTNAFTAGASFTFAVETTNFGAGPVAFQARADSSAGFSALSTVAILSLHIDRDGDGLSDQWEYAQLGSASNATPTADPDGDGVSNLYEFLADTSPTNASDFLRITSLAASSNALHLVHAARTTRVYRLDHTETLLGLWQTTTNEFTAPASNQLVWPLASTGTLDYIRVRARLP